MNYELKKYPKYKPSGIEWIGEIPEHWEVKKLRFIGNFSSSGIDKKINEDEPLVKIINYTDVYGNSSRILDSKRNYMEVSCSEVKRIEHKVSKGDLIFTPSSETIEDIGLSALVDEDLENTAFSYHVLRFRFEKEVCHSFKKYLCNNNLVLSYFSANARGTTRQTLSRDNFNSAIVILPPNEEQTAIANFLDEKTAKIDSLIEKKKKLIELYKEEKTALINQAVTRGINPNVKLKPSGIDWLGDIPEHWEVKKLKYVAKLRDEVINDTDFKIAVENIESGSGKLINMVDYKNYQGKLSAFKRGDTIFNKLRPYLHKVYFAERDGGLFGELLVIHSLGELLPKFLFLKLFSKLFIDIVDGSTQGTKMPRADWNDFICLLPLSFPKSIEEQQQIVEYIESETKRIDNKIARAEKEIELLQEYRTALISEVVTGKIKV